ncbi:MAG: hypothetical protein RL266_1808 [Bacteroidota bacterium]|jgi:hypothetical protein
MPLLQDQHHRNLAFWGMALIAAGLPLSVFLVSVGNIVLALNWLLQGNLRQRLTQFFTNPIGLSVSAVFLLFCLGLIHTQNYVQGWKELRITVPLLAVPLFLFTSKMPSIARINDVLKLFVLACMVGALFGTARYVGVVGDELVNSRQLSVFISHIRFGLMLVLALFILIYSGYSNWSRLSRMEQAIHIVSFLWLAWFLIILEAFTAYVALMCASAFGFLWFLAKSRRIPTSIGSILVGTSIIIVFGIHLRSIIGNHYHEVPFDYRTLTVKTVNGNYYAHQKDVLYRENGHRVWNFVCWDELSREWPRKSGVDFEGSDKKGQPIKFTAVRYMTSKGLLKDSVGLHQLTNEDIANIEAGFTNHLYTDKLGFSRRVDQVLWALEEYSWHRNANNSSTMQRWVYMQTGWEIFKKHFVLGVGTGDVVDAYKAEYQLNPHGLEPKFQGISHNQFLTIAIVSGIFGFAIFLCSLAYPMWYFRRDFLFQIFMVIMLVSFFTDNTLSRQSGVALFAFFSAILAIRKEFAELN